jgi:hypothetical protein
MIQIILAFHALLWIDRVGSLLKKSLHGRIGPFDFTSAQNGAPGSDDFAGRDGIAYKKKAGETFKIPQAGSKIAGCAGTSEDRLMEGPDMSARQSILPLLRFTSLGSRNAGLRNRANRIALRMLELIRAFRAGLGIDDVGLVLERNRRRGAFEFTSAANGALRSDDFVGHGSAPLTKGLERPVSCPKPNEKMSGIRHRQTSSDQSGEADRLEGFGHGYLTTNQQDPYQSLSI